MKKYEGRRIDRSNDKFSWINQLKSFPADFTDVHSFKENYLDNVDVMKILFKQLFNAELYQLLEKYITEFVDVRNKIKTAEKTNQKTNYKIVTLKNL